MQLDYPITRKFPCRYFTHYTILFMVIVIALVTLFNIAAVGYDLAPFYSQTFDPQRPYWWSRFDKVTSFKESPQCESRRLNTRDRFATELGIFEYIVESLLEGGHSVPAVSYNGTDLEDCQLSQMLVTVDTPEASTSFRAHFTCITGEARLNVSTGLVLSPNRDKDTMFSRYLSEGQFSTIVHSHPTISPIVLTLRGLSLDVDNTAFYVPPTRTAAVPHTRHWDIHFLSCSEAAEILETEIADCASRRMLYKVNRVYRSYSSGYVNVTYDQDTETPTTRNAISNLIYAFASAVLVDLGFAPQSNMFKNETLRRIELKSQFNESEAYPIEEQWFMNLTETIQLSTPFAGRFLDDPSQFAISLPIPDIEPMKIDSSFLCRQWQRKPWPSFIASIAAATFSFCLAIWAGYMGIAMYFAKKKHVSGNHCTCQSCSDNSPDATAVPLLQDSNSTPAWEPKTAEPY